MSRVTNTDRILNALEKWPDLDDDELSKAAEVHPRQQVNQICRRLEKRRIIERLSGPDGKIVNRLVGSFEGPISAQTNNTPQPSRTAHTHSESVRISDDISDTMILIPCSGTKTSSLSLCENTKRILDDLPPELANRLIQARYSLRDQIALDETHLMPAWERYSGALYRAARPALAELDWASSHILIISGGYGIIRGNEAIGTYNAVFKRSQWPHGLLEEVLAEYAQRHEIRKLRALASATTHYGRLITNVPWLDAGVVDAILMSPEPCTGAMVKSPRAQGEALESVLTTGIDTHWRSSDGLKILYKRLD